MCWRSLHYVIGCNRFGIYKTLSLKPPSSMYSKRKTLMLILSPSMAFPSFRDMIYEHLVDEVVCGHGSLRFNLSDHWPHWNLDYDFIPLIAISGSIFLGQ